MHDVYCITGITLAPGQFPAPFPQLKSRDELQISQSDLAFDLQERVFLLEKKIKQFIYFSIYRNTKIIDKRIY